MIFSKTAVSEAAFLIVVILCGQSVELLDASSQEQIQKENEVFYNPILDYYSPDPYVTKLNGVYWMVLSDSWAITVYKSNILSDFRGAETRVAYRAGEGLDLVWAPEIHFIDGDWYIYFAMNGNGTSHRTYVIKADDSLNPLGSWSQPIRIQLDAVHDEWAIDSTVLQYGNGKKYLIWSAWPREDPPHAANGSIYIAQLETPFKIIGERTLLREPHEDWEAGLWEGDERAWVNEAPQVLQNNGRTFVIFSANGAWLPDYCLGMMGIDDLKDPLVPSNWWNKVDGPVFWRNDDENVYTTGHCSFTTSPDDRESWIVYHATDKILPPGEITTIRKSRAERFTWNWDGTPSFPRPSGFTTPLRVPSGEF